MSVLNSRRLWTLILDVIVSSVIYGVSHFGTPSTQEFAKFVIVTLQPVAIFLIGAYTVDDVKATTAQKEVELHAITNGVHPDYPPVVPDQSGQVLTSEEIQARMTGKAQ